MTVAFFALFGFIFLITQFFQLLQGYGPLETGVRILPVALSIAVGSVVGTRLAVTRVGTKAVVFTGLLMLTAAFAWVATIDIDVPYLQVAAQMVLLGGGLGLTTAPATDSIMGVVRPEQAGAGSAVNDATRQVGGTLGVAVVGSIFSTLYIRHLSDSEILRTAPESAQATAREGLAQGLQVAAQSPAIDRRSAPRHGQRRLHVRPAGRLRDRRRGVPGRGVLRARRSCPPTRRKRSRHEKSITGTDPGP